MDFSTAKDGSDFTLIPEGTVVEAIISKAEAKPGKNDPSKTVLHLEFEVSKGEYVYTKVLETITIAGMDAESLEWGRSKIKRMLEYANEASATNMSGYIVPETMGSSGKMQPKWSDLVGKFIGFQTKLESFTSNKSGETLLSNKVGAYASKNKDSGGYKFYEAIKEGRQPWQKPLPEIKAQKSKSQTAGMPDFEIPIDAY